MSSEKLTRAAVNNLQYFTADKYSKTKELVLSDLKKEYGFCNEHSHGLHPTNQ